MQGASAIPARERLARALVAGTALTTDYGNYRIPVSIRSNHVPRHSRPQSRRRQCVGSKVPNSPGTTPRAPSRSPVVFLRRGKPLLPSFRLVPLSTGAKTIAEQVRQTVDVHCLCSLPSSMNCSHYLYPFVPQPCAVHRPDERGAVVVDPFDGYLLDRSPPKSIKTVTRVPARATAGHLQTCS